MLWDLLIKCAFIFIDHAIESGTDDENKPIECSKLVREPGNWYYFFGEGSGSGQNHVILLFVVAKQKNNSF